DMRKIEIKITALKKNDRIRFEIEQETERFYKTDKKKIRVTKIQAERKFHDIDREILVRQVFGMDGSATGRNDQGDPAAAVVNVLTPFDHQLFQAAPDNDGRHLPHENIMIDFLIVLQLFSVTTCH